MSVDSFKAILIDESIYPGIFFENVRDSGAELNKLKKRIWKCKTRKEAVKLINEYC